MLTPLQVGQFRAMGFLKLEACLAPDEVAHDHLIETAGPRRRAMVARLRELAIA